jgi:hypothetical protein
METIATTAHDTIKPRLMPLPIERNAAVRELVADTAVSRFILRSPPVAFPPAGIANFLVYIATPSGAVTIGYQKVAPRQGEGI